MVDVIQVNAADGKIAKLLKRGSWFYVREHGGLRLESKRERTGKTPPVSSCICGAVANDRTRCSERLEYVVEPGCNVLRPPI
jgi:hypothetical protein